MGTSSTPPSLITTVSTVTPASLVCSLMVSVVTELKVPVLVCTHTAAPLVLSTNT